MRLIVLLTFIMAWPACATVVRGPESCGEAISDSYDRTQRGNDYRTSGNGFRIGLHQQAGEAALMTSWSTSGSAQFEIPEGTTIDIAFANGATTQIRTTSPAAPIVDIGGYGVGVGTHWNVEARLTPDALAILSEVGVQAARLRVQGIEMTMQLDPVAQANMQTLAICFAGGY